MRKAVQSFLRSAEFKESILAALPPDRATVALSMMEHLANFEYINEYGVPLMKGTSAFDLGLYMLFIEALDKDAKTEVLAEICGVGTLSCKKWNNRLKVECMVEVEWVRPVNNVRGNIGKFVISNWGIYDKTVYSVFRPYAKMVVDNYMSSKQLGHSES